MTRPASRRFGAARVALILAVVCLTSIGIASPASAHGNTKFVRPGQSIQAAIDAAHPGDRILVRPGTYAEQLTIDKNGIDLIGLDATLVPPPSAAQNDCSNLAGPGTEAGICLHGSGIALADYVVEHRKVLSVDRPVEDVSIAGFQVRGFSGENIAVIGARDARVIGNRLTDGERYGFLTAGSNNTLIAGNTVASPTALRFIGICIDDRAGSNVSDNRISGYSVAICVQTPGGIVRHNNVRDSCFGAFVDPGVDGAKILDNHIAGTNPACATSDSPVAFGIFLDGAINTLVRHNRIEGQGGLPNGAGVLVFDQVTEQGTAVASGNVVTRNVLRNNDLDLAALSVGTGNVFSGNSCTTSDPAGLCA